MKWFVPDTKLDTDQREILTSLGDGSRNTWLQGPAGAGKSVILAHLLYQLREKTPKPSICVVIFTHSLIDQYRSGLPEDLRGVPIMTPYQFAKQRDFYDVVIVDEVQDLQVVHLEAIRQRAKRVVLAGDGAQQLYGNIPGIGSDDDLVRLFSPHKQVLSILYRITPGLVRVISSFFKGRGLEGKRNGRQKTVQVVVAQATSRAEEVDYAWTTARERSRSGACAALLFRHHAKLQAFVNDVLRREGKPACEIPMNRYNKPDYEVLNAHFSKHGIPAQYIGNTYGSLEQADRSGHVLFMTYHSAKGLDFETVMLPGLDTSADIEAEDTAFYVALTRSRLELFLTYTGRPHAALQQVLNEASDDVLRLSLPLKPTELTQSSPTSDFFF